MAQVGTGKYAYKLMQDFPKLPAGQSFGVVSTVATDSQDRVYVFQRQEPPVKEIDLGLTTNHSVDNYVCVG